MENGTHVRILAEYLTPDEEREYTQRAFCGTCNLELGGNGGHGYFGWPRNADDLLRENDAPWPRPFRKHDGEPLRYYTFCPWCGTKFEDEYWKGKLENERAIDHYRNPGHHKGDSHVFTGHSPMEAVAGHYLSTTSDDEICWCDPEVTPSLLGCEIRHQAVQRDR